MTGISRKTILTLVVLHACCVGVTAQDISARQNREIKSISKQIDKAERYLDSERIEVSARELGKAYDRIMKMAAEANADLIKALEPEYRRVSDNHGKLKTAGLELPDLAALPEPLTDTDGGSSFVKVVAPILAQRCGRCHVDQSRGEFSARSFDSLMASTHVSPGRPDTSRLIEVIVDGDMPPNGNGIPDEELQSIKLWIRTGAKFDGDDPAAAIAAASPRQNRRAAVPSLDDLKPTGNETVSFGRDVAPILIENCNGCHIGGRQIRGNLNMANFARMLRGGDNGSPIAAGKPMDSLILKRLRGIDSDVMPPRRKLSDDKIATIETWIAEGAKFDGESATIEISTVAEVAATKSKTHDNVVSDRDSLARKNWKLIMSSNLAELNSTKNFRVLGDDRVPAVGELAEIVVADVAKSLGAQPNEPFVKGNVSIYLFDKRYDLNELGMMLVNRKIDTSETGRWDFTTVDAYAAFLLPDDRDLEELRPHLAQQLTAIWIASRSTGTPRWFADAAGYLIAARIDRKASAVRDWQQAALSISKNLEDPGAFARGKLSDRDAGLAGYVFVENLKKSGQLKALMNRISSGEPFDDAFNSVMGKPPADYFQPQRRRRR